MHVWLKLGNLAGRETENAGVNILSVQVHEIDDLGIEADRILRFIRFEPDVSSLLHAIEDYKFAGSHILHLAHDYRLLSGVETVDCETGDTWLHMTLCVLTTLIEFVLFLT